MPKLLLDLDRTLFNTPQFVQTLWEWIGQIYGPEAQAGHENMREYFTYVEDMYSYDFFAHVAKLGIDTADLAQRSRRDFSGKTFIYDDVPDFLVMSAELDRAILTFGESAYQQFKLMFCPELNDLVVYNTMRPKREYIEAHWPDQPIVLIDDKLLVGKLAANTKFIHLDREQAEPSVEHEGYESINSLAAVEKQWLV